MGTASRAIRFVAVLLVTYVVGLAAIVGGVLLSSVILVVLGGAIAASMPVMIGWQSWRERNDKRQSTAVRPD